MHASIRENHMGASPHLQSYIVTSVIASPKGAAILPYNNSKDEIASLTLAMTNTQKNDMASIILGHGSRVAAANKTIIDIARMVTARYGVAAHPAFLQLAEPLLPEIIAKLVTREYTRIIIMPCFLTSGNHVRKDIPSLIRSESGKYKGIQLLCTKHLGADARIVDLAIDRIEEAIRGENI